MFRCYSINVVGKTIYQCPALCQQQKAPRVVFFRDLDVNHGGSKIRALGLAVKKRTT